MFGKAAPAASPPTATLSLDSVWILPAPMGDASNFSVVQCDKLPGAFRRRTSCFATLTDRLGKGTIEVVATRLETDEAIRSRRIPIQFPERLTVVRLMARRSGFSFPAPGRYQFNILLDGEWLAQISVRVVQSGA